MGSFKKLARGSILIFFGSVLGSAFAYFFRMVLTRRISVEEYGLFAAVFAFVSLFEILRNLGIYSALTKYVSHAFALKNETGGKKIIFVSIIIEVLLAGFIALILKSLDSFLALNYFKQPFAPFVLNWMLAYFILETVSTGIQHSFLGVQKSELFALKKPLFNILSFIFVIVLPVKDARLPIMALVLGLGGTLFALSYFFSRIFRPFVKIKYKDFKIFLPKLLKFGIPTAIASLGAIAIAQFDTLMLTYLKTLGEVGIYNVVLPTALLLGFIGDAAGRVLFPYISELEAKKELSKIKEKFLTAYRFTLMPAVLISLPLLLFPGYLLGLFFGSDYSIGASALQILLVGVFFSIISGINMNIIYGLGYPKIGMKITLFAAFLNIVLNLILIPQFGIIGAAFATFLSFFVMAVWSFFFLSQKIHLFFPQRFFFFLFSSWLIAFISGGLIKNLFFENFALIWQAVYSSILAGLAFLLLIWFSGIFKTEDFYKIISIFNFNKKDE